MKISRLGTMKGKYFLRNFRYFFRLMMIPLLLLFIASVSLTVFHIDREIKVKSENTISNINTNLDFVISGVIFQNDQLTNNSHMLLALKKLLKNDTNIRYSDAIYLRNIKTLMRSITQSYPYMNSVYLYLDGYDKYFSSSEEVTSFKREDDLQWKNMYENMQDDKETMVVMRTVKSGNSEMQVITIFQRMLLLDGVVVMNIEVDKYLALLDQILYSSHETIIFYAQDGSYLFSWNPDNDWQFTDITLQQTVKNGGNGSWTKIGNKQYMVHENYNQRYQMYIVSLVSENAVLDGIRAMVQFFVWFCLICTAVMLFLAYRIAKRSFNNIEYMIDVFQRAETGEYLTEPKQHVEDEYDVVLNNIIHLFLHNMKLNHSLLEKQKEQEKAELTALQLQINPHFLFNVLQTAKFEMQRLGGTARHVEKIVEDLSDILKYALKHPMETISLEEEIQYLKKYVAIQQFRFGQTFIVYYEIDEQLRDISVFRLMLQPLVENSILHGTRAGQRQGYIKVKIRQSKGQIIFQVIDNGVGMSRSEMEKLRKSIQKNDINHIGLSNVNCRLKLYYGENAGIVVKSKKGFGSVVQFALPASTYPDSKSDVIK